MDLESAQKLVYILTGTKLEPGGLFEASLSIVVQQLASRGRTAPVTLSLYSEIDKLKDEVLLARLDALAKDEDFDAAAWRRSFKKTPVRLEGPVRAAFEIGDCQARKIHNLWESQKSERAFYARVAAAIKAGAGLTKDGRRVLRGLAADEEGVRSVNIESGVIFTSLRSGADLSAVIADEVEFVLKAKASAFIMAPPGQASVDAVYVLSDGGDGKPRAYLLQLTVNRDHADLPREPVVRLVDALESAGVVNVKLLVVFPEGTVHTASMPCYTGAADADARELPPIHVRSRGAGAARCSRRGQARRRLVGGQTGFAREQGEPLAEPEQVAHRAGRLARLASDGSARGGGV